MTAATLAFGGGGIAVQASRLFSPPAACSVPSPVAAVEAAAAVMSWRLPLSW
jgi:hypothetical protein